MTIESLTAYKVTRVRDADGASCLDCGYVVGRFWREGMVPWSWRQSQHMHEQGSHHKMQLFAVERKP